MKNLVKILCAATIVLSSSVLGNEKNFCPMPNIAPSESERDTMFVNAMFEAEYVFKGRLFTYYNEKCDDEICAYQGLVFQVLEDLENETPSYVETSWHEDCDRLWLFPTDWREDKEQMFFEIKKDYLILAKDTPRGMVVTGARKGLKIKELKMKFTLESLANDK